MHLRLVNAVSFFWLTSLLVPICSSQGSYFVSPGDRTYDALGLVKQINVHSAAALAEAREVLASGNRCDDRNSDKENRGNTDAKKEPGTSKLQTKVMVCSSQLLNLVFLVIVKSRFLGDPNLIVCQFLRYPLH